MKSFTKTREKVEHILQNYPETRNNDNHLFRLYSQIYHGIILPPIESIVPYESLSRARRFFQSRGQYLAEEVVRVARAKNRKEYQKEYSPQQYVSGL